MIEILIFILILSIGLYILKNNGFKREGQTQGICTKVVVELSPDDGSTFNEQLPGMDPRMYRIYIQYEWNGEQYVAKSYRAYSKSNCFPGDIVRIWVNEYDKSIVDIIDYYGINI